ncbi:hypothetical protein [Natrialba aegyptia]|uniref:hypothetical protein n=1 Tax=Natrialba aegyptia TaxID=129789 RepID=UPI000A04B80E|nr:hypothetical protein [Natrialba aegyptia]
MNRTEQTTCPNRRTDETVLASAARSSTTVGGWRSQPPATLVAGRPLVPDNGRHRLRVAQLVPRPDLLGQPCIETGLIIDFPE